MTIEVKSQYRLRFKLSNLEDFITNDDLIEFTIIEEAGNLLPIFKLDFFTYNEEVIRLLNETNALEVSFGKDANEMYDVSLYVTRLESEKQGKGKRLIATTGLAGSLEYLNNPKVLITEEMSGIEAMTLVANQHFDVDVDPEVSDDLQCWIQPNMSDRRFINQIWMHSYLVNGFIGVGISADGTFIVRDLKSKAGEEFDWKFTPTPSGSSDIVYDPDPKIIINGGFINHWLGYGRENLELALEDGTSELISEEARPILALTEEIARKANMERKFHSSVVRTTNVHENYWRAAQKNLTNLAILGNVKIVLSYTGVFQRTRVLDLAMFKDEDISDASQKASAEYHSGLYYISKVSRTFSAKQLCTVVEMVRESLNRITGEVMESESVD